MQHNRIEVLIARIFKQRRQERPAQAEQAFICHGIPPHAIFAYCCINFS
nr:MAG TPA: hypothetical protein [Caudoviricetes sp.]